MQVREFEQLMAHMQPVFKPLLKPHLEDLEKKVAPGLFILTWASMNVDGYLHRFKQVRAAHTACLPAGLPPVKLLPHLCKLTSGFPDMLTAHLLQGLARLEELARKLMDIVDNRVQANLDAVKEMLLVDLPADRCAHALPVPVLRSCSAVKWTVSNLQPTNVLTD